MTSLDDMMAAIEREPKKRIAVAVAQDETVLQAVKEADERNIADSILVGDKEAIQKTAEAVGLQSGVVDIVHEPRDTTAAKVAAQLVHDHAADIMMKGHIHTDDFLRGLLDPETGLRTGSIMSHVFLLDTKHLGRLTLVTDGAMNIAPDLLQKGAIIMNAVYLCHLLGIECPKVGVVCAVELVNPKMPATMEAAALSVMSRRGQFPRCIVDGPFALDNALSVVAARHKGIVTECAGQCDVLLMPDIEAGNMLAKSFTYLADGRVAGVLIGAAAPVVLTSRADTAESKLYSIATAVLMAHMKRDSRMKIGKVHF